MLHVGPRCDPRTRQQKLPPKIYRDGEVIAIGRSELQRNRGPLQAELASGLPLILGDRIQLQQVILKLLINAIEAMNCMSEGSRDLRVTSETVGELPDRGREGMLEAEATVDSTHVLIAVRDSGQDWRLNLLIARLKRSIQPSAWPGH